jgi:D-3-phosphoglycerate dehydrogenase
MARRIPRTDALMREGEWPKGQGTQMHGKTLGIVGLGAIGRRFAQLGQAIGMRVITWTMHPKPELGFESVALEQLLRESDVVSLHLRLSNETRGMIGEREFGMMKPSAILINTARGPIVDETAMIAALKNGRIAGAGIDVFDIEPLPADHPIRRLPNTVITAHSAGVTPEALEAGLQMAVDNVFHFLDGAAAHVV